VSSFSTSRNGVVSELPSRQRAAENHDWERTQLLAAREQRRANRRMLALSARPRLSARLDRRTGSEGVASGRG
jgi:hypothetical protein